MVEIHLDLTEHQAQYILDNIRPFVLVTAIHSDEGQAWRKLFNVIEYKLKERYKKCGTSLY